MAPSCAAKFNAVKPRRSGTLGSAPSVSSLLMASASLASAAQGSGVRPPLSMPALSGRRVVGAFDEPAGHCCVMPPAQGQRMITRMLCWSDGDCQVIESDAEPVAAGDVGGDVVAAAAQVLHEGVTDGEGPR